MTPVSGNTHEMVLNAALAQLLRSRGLEAEAEQSVRSESRWHRVDVLVELGEFAVAIEAEFAPGHTVRGDAESRLTEDPLASIPNAINCLRSSADSHSRLRLRPAASLVSR